MAADQHARRAAITAVAGRGAAAALCTQACLLARLHQYSAPAAGSILAQQSARPSYRPATFRWASPPRRTPSLTSYACFSSFPAACVLLPQIDSFEREVVEYVKPNHGTTTLGFIFQVGHTCCCRWRTVCCARHAGSLPTLCLSDACSLARSLPHSASPTWAATGGSHHRGRLASLPGLLHL